MGIIELLLTAVALSMDAFAVSLCKGLCMKKFSASRALIIGLFFGAFQALMPLIGYFLGTQFEGYIKPFDHWIAFALLCYIGGKMVYDSLRGEESEDCGRFSLKEMLVLSVATSIDALAVGITLSFVGVTGGIFPAVGIIGFATLAISFGGVYIGYRCGARFQHRAELFGGIVLIAIGLKILIEHLLA